MTDRAAAFLDEMMNGRKPSSRGVAPITVPVITPRPRTERPRGLSKKGSEAKGKRLQLLAKEHYESLGCRVEICPKRVIWIPGPTGKRFPITRAQDYFHLWDLLIVWPDAARSFAQVTTANNLWRTPEENARRQAFPTTERDVILGYEGRNVFRVFRGPEFTVSDERLVVTRRKRCASIRRRPTR